MLQRHLAIRSYVAILKDDAFGCVEICKYFSSSKECLSVVATSIYIIVIN